MSSGAPDYSGMKVDVVLRPEWAAKEGTDKTLVTDGAILAFGESDQVSYAVPAAKDLYITSVTAWNRAAAAANADLPQICIVSVTYAAGVVTLLYVGGNGGVSPPISPPLVVPGGQTVVVAIVNFANHATVAGVVAKGYEV